MITMVLRDINNEKTITGVRSEAKALCDQFPLFQIWCDRTDNYNRWKGSGREVEAETLERAKKLANKGIVPGLATVLVGENPPRRCTSVSSTPPAPERA